MGFNSGFKGLNKRTNLRPLYIFA